MRGLQPGEGSVERANRTLQDRLVFSKDQRVSHTATVENKHLGHALAIVKAQQDLRLATKVMTNSEKTGYKKRVRSSGGLASTVNS